MARPYARNREIIGLWAALAIIACVAALTYRSIDAAGETVGWMGRTSVVLRQIEVLAGAYARATTARRAYAVAGDDSQLASIPELDSRVHETVDVLRVSLADNPGQLRRLGSLHELVKQRLAALDAAVARRKLEGAAPENAEGLALAARIRNVREAMMAEESRVLAEREGQTRRDVARTKVAEVLGTLLSSVLILLAFSRLRQEASRRERSEQALRASEGFLDSIVENLPNMVFVKEASELRFERFNRAGEQLLGVDRADLVGKNDFDFFPREQAEAFQARDRETLAGGAVVDILEEPIQTKRGERWLHTKKVPVCDEDGAPRYLLGISDDITEARDAALALRDAKETAEAANQELEAFSYSVAHDLRAPLRAIDGFSQALEEDCAAQLSPEGKQHLERVRGSARQMSRLIDGLLELSQLTRRDIVREKVDLSRLVAESAGRLRENHPDRSVELVVAPDLDALGDPGLLTAALDNLLGNSWKFTGKCDHPRVEVGRRMDDGHSVFFVKDNGAGFEQEYVHKLFGAFQRLHGAHEFEGSGIGLATVQRIVRRHGGRIWAEGAVGQGATFYFTL